MGADWEAARLCFQKELLYIKHYFTFTHIHTSSFYLVLVKIWVSNFNVTTSSHSMVLFSSAWFEFSLQVFIFVNSIWFFRTFLLTGKENGKMNTEYIDIFGDDMFIFFHWKIPNHKWSPLFQLVQTWRTLLQYFLHFCRQRGNTLHNLLQIYFSSTGIFLQANRQIEK